MQGGKTNHTQAKRFDILEIIISGMIAQYTSLHYRITPVEKHRVRKVGYRSRAKLPVNKVAKSTSSFGLSRFLSNEFPKES